MRRIASNVAILGCFVPYALSFGCRESSMTPDAPLAQHLWTIQSRRRREGRCRHLPDGMRNRCTLPLSSGSDDSPGGDDDAPGDIVGPTPLFPELTSSSSSLDVSQPRQASYDEAADALLNFRRGRPSDSNNSGERALSASDEIRYALEVDGLAGAARAIKKAMAKGGDWYEPGAEAEDGGDRNRSLGGGS